MEEKLTGAHKLSYHGDEVVARLVRQEANAWEPQVMLMSMRYPIASAKAWGVGFVAIVRCGVVRAGSGRVRR